MRVSLWPGLVANRVAGGVAARARAACGIVAAKQRARAWDALGRALLRRGRPWWAAQCCRRATALESDNVQRWRHRAAAAMRAGAFAEAALCYRALVRLEPEAPRSYARLARVYERMGAIRAAVEVCCQGLRRQPGARILHRRLAALLLQSEAAAAPVSRLLGLPGRSPKGMPPAVAWHGDASAYLTQRAGTARPQPATLPGLRRQSRRQMLASQGDAGEGPVAALATDEAAPANLLDVS